MVCSLPGSTGILQARILGWVAMPSSKGSSWSRNQTCISYVSCIGRQVLYHQHHLGNPSFPKKLIFEQSLRREGGIKKLQRRYSQRELTKVWKAEVCLAYSRDSNGANVGMEWSEQRKEQLEMSRRGVGGMGNPCRAPECHRSHCGILSRGVTWSFQGFELRGDIIWFIL